VAAIPAGSTDYLANVAIALHPDALVAVAERRRRLRSTSDSTT
jgi:hypothetical protein